MTQETAHCSLTALDHLVLTVADKAATIMFYTQVLGMRHTRFDAADGTERDALFFGRQKINLHAASCPFAPHANSPVPGSADLCFLTETDVATWQTHLAGFQVPIEEGPVARSGATGALTSLYIRDPDGNLVEIAQQAT